MAQGNRHLGFTTWKMKLLTMWTEFSLQPYNLLFLLKCIYFVITTENTSVFHASECLSVAIFSFSDIMRKLAFASCKMYIHVYKKICFVANHISLEKAWDIIVTVRAKSCYKGKKIHTKEKKACMANNWPWVWSPAAYISGTVMYNFNPNIQE